MAGINDIDTLKLSLINLRVIIALSLATSFIFLLIPIFRDEISEILERTAPDVRDIFIALATFVIIKFLQLQMLKYINSMKKNGLPEWPLLLHF